MSLIFSSAKVWSKVSLARGNRSKNAQRFRKDLFRKDLSIDEQIANSVVNQISALFCNSIRVRFY